MRTNSKSVLLVIVFTTLSSIPIAGCNVDSNPTSLADVGGSGDARDVSLTDVHGDISDVDASHADADDSSYNPSWSECDCPNPEEKCTSRFCGLPDAGCDPGDGVACPEGYTCMRDVPFGAFVCVCKGDHDSCTPECERQEDCPASGLSCSYDDGVCRWNRNTTGSCMTTMQCPDGYYCDPMHWRCQPTGDLATGEGCDWDSDCQTGICNRITGKCDEQCLSDSDCPEDAYCINFGGGWQGYDGCSVNVNCQVSCPPEKRCGGDQCLPPACETTGDCSTGDCQLDPDRPEAFLPSCVEHDDSSIERYCKPEERIGTLEYCYLPGPCWDNSHCDEPYVCESGQCRRWLDHDEEDM